MNDILQYNIVSQSLDWLATHPDASWKSAAERAGFAPHYFQRLFKRYTGVSPRQYTACLNLSVIKRRLLAGDSVYDAALAAGLSGGGRAHDLFVTIDGVSPGEFSRRGEGVAIDYGVADSLYGEIFIAMTARGVCLLEFVRGGHRAATEAAKRRLAGHWPRAILRRNPARAADMAARIFSSHCPLDARGTNFQLNVWRALLNIPVGRVISYQALAQAVTGAPRHARAVARAVATNPVAVLIPCHRVLSKDGRLTGYAWGVEQKRKLLAHEIAAHPL